MAKILEATYSNGSLILSEALDANLEGKKLKVVILEAEDGEADRIAKVNRFLEHAKQYSFALPSDYKFDRDELYDR